MVILGDDPGLAAGIEEIAQLVGMQVRRCRENGAELQSAPLLVAVTEDGARTAAAHSDVPIVRVSAVPGEGDLSLPQDAPAVASLLSASGSGPSASSPGRKTLVVAGWQGGTGVSTTAFHFAGAGDAILLDASGHPPAQGPEDGQLHWGMVDPADLPLLPRRASTAAGLPTVEVLSAAPLLVRVDDPRVSALSAQVAADVVVDAGVWSQGVDGLLVENAARGRQIRLVLVGRADDKAALRLVSLLASLGPIWRPQALYTRDKVSESLQIIGSHAGLPVARLPRIGRAGNKQQWRRLWEGLWHG